jgi:hypothetical protein
MVASLLQPDMFRPKHGTSVQRLYRFGDAEWIELQPKTA